MRAVFWQAYGGADVLKLGEMDTPRPAADELLIKVHASTVTAADARLRAMAVPVGFGLATRLAFGLTKPRHSIPGMEFSGEVVDIGSKVTRFTPGEQVFGTAGMRLGAHAEYLCVAETTVICQKPVNLSHQQSVASLFGGLTAIHFLKDKVALGAGKRLLINGASGAVGTAAIQLAKEFGAEVWGICSGANAAMAQGLGADLVLDYQIPGNQAQDYSAKGGLAFWHELGMEEGASFDVILDAVGNLNLACCRHLLGQGGKLIRLNTDLMGNLQALVEPRVIAGVALESTKNLQLLKTLLEAGRFAPVIDSVYPLADIAAAHRRVDSHRKRGSVVIDLID